MLKDYTGKGIEVDFDDVVLVCVFENKVCGKSILYFNNLYKIAEYIRYCDSMFKCNKKHGIWYNANSYLSLEFPDGYDKRFAFVHKLVQ